MSRRPGDRRRVYSQSCNIKGLIMLVIGFALLFGVEGTAAIIWGSVCVFFGLLEFLDGQRGWKLRDDLPPWADKDWARKMGIKHIERPRRG